MVSEPTHVTPQQREQLVQLLFERFSPPALFLTKCSVLSSFAVGRPTSLVIDCGASGTTVSAVHDGYAMQLLRTRSPLGGQALTDLTLRVCQAGGTELRPRYTFKRTSKDGSFFVTPTQHAGVTASYALEQQWRVAADVKESCCRVYESRLDDAAVASQPSAPYELPDGTVLEFGAERFKIPELLLEPARLASFPLPMDLPAGGIGELAGSCAGLKGIAAACADVISKADVDLRRELYGGIVLTGGGSLFPGLKERLERELVAASPQAAKVKLLASASTAERRFGVWLGGSILASLGSFQQLWMSKAEYEERGAAYIHKKCP